MAQTIARGPVSDVGNDGWTVFGATEAWEALVVSSDAEYIKAPSYQGRVTLGYPSEISLPDGAIIDSVTVLVRMKTQAGSGPRSVTVDMLSSDNAARYTSRTLYATSAFTLFEVGTYTRDALGYSWDPHRLDSVLLRLHSTNDLADSVRVSQLYLRVNYHTKPSVEVSGPSGTLVSPTPVVTWDYSHTEGEPQEKAQVRVFTAAQVGSLSSFNPDAETPVFDEMVIGSGVLYQLPTSLPSGSYRVYVRAWSEHNAKSDWSARDFIVRPSTPGVPGDNNAGDSGTPGVGTPTAIPDTFTSSAQIRMQDASNLLSAQQADFEIAFDSLEWLGTNCGVARATGEYYGDGVASMSLVANSSGDMVAETTYLDIGPNRPLTLRIQGLTGATSRTCELYADYFDDTFTQIGGSDRVSIADVTSTWTEAALDVTTPIDTVYVRMVYRVVGAAADEIHYVDHAGVMNGHGTAWSDGGHQSRNLLSSYLSTADDPVSGTETWVAANSTPTTVSRVTGTGSGKHGTRAWQMAYGSQAASITFRAASTVNNSATLGTGYTLDKPSGTVSGDLMLAFVTSSGQGDIVPPSGWKKVNKATVNDGSADLSLFVLKRTAGSSEPSTWATGRLTVAADRRSTAVVSYAGAAPADEQFIAENVRSDGGGARIHRTQTVVNSDANAWRVGAFAASDNVTGGSFSASATAPTAYPPDTRAAATPKIRFVNASARWVEHRQTTQFRLNRPAGVRSGDLMVASIALSGRVTTVTAPSGWTLVHRVHEVFPNSSGGDAHSGDVTVAVFKRTAGSSEPSAWTGTHGQWGQPKVTQVVAYRNCADASEQFISQGSNSAVNTSKVSTPHVTNSDSRAWRVSVFGATTPFRSSWSGGDVSERSDASTDLDSFPDAVLKFSDSNGPVATGQHWRTATINSRSNRYSNVPSGNFFTGIGWIGLIKPLPIPPSVSGDSMPVGTEEERIDNANGGSGLYLHTAVYDSSGVAPTGATSLYGIFAPGSPTTNLVASSMASWVGIIKPGVSAPNGQASVVSNIWTDISKVDPEVLALANNKITVMASFLGHQDGTPLLGLQFARGGRRTGEVAAKGTVFNTETWVKAWATFDLPSGTTRVWPVLSADDRGVGDSIMFDRVSVQFGEPADGEVPAYRNGTSRREHPIWSKPFIQYSDDPGTGYEVWADLPGQKLIAPLFDPSTGELSYVDHSIIPLNLRKYRARVISYGLQGETFSSGYSPESDEASFTSVNWWLKDFTDLDANLRLRVEYKDFKVDTDNTTSVYHPLGEDYPVVLSEGYKADSLEISIYCDRQEEASLYRLLRSGRTLVLQSDTDYVWWVRPVDVLSVNNLAVSQLRRTTDPIKLITVRFVEVKTEE